ncbi:hypothetical protein HAX54_042859, partial [Datura stramonium]|nr:hypothetical protein [Datura stramonium]
MGTISGLHRPILLDDHIHLRVRLATSHTHSSPPVSCVPYGTRHLTYSSVPSCPTTSQTFMPIADILSP